MNSKIVPQVRKSNLIAHNWDMSCLENNILLMQMNQAVFNLLIKQKELKKVMQSIICMFTKYLLKMRNKLETLSPQTSNK